MGKKRGEGTNYDKKWVGHPLNGEGDKENVLMLIFMAPEVAVRTSYSNTNTC